eukprot:12882335-Prorocentrum_lima.AAC.1
MVPPPEQKDLPDIELFDPAGSGHCERQLHPCALLPGEPVQSQLLEQTEKGVLLPGLPVPSQLPGQEDKGM